MFVLFTIIGAIASVISIIQFLTGRPSIQHFAPLRKGHFETLAASPFFKARFSEREDTLYVHAQGREVALLPHLSYLADYRIFVSQSRKKLLVVYRSRQREAPFKRLIVANYDGSSRQEHDYYGSVIVDVRWFDDHTYLVFLEHDPHDQNRRGYPAFWRRLNPSLIGILDWNAATVERGNYLVRLDSSNKVIDLKKF